MVQFSGTYTSHSCINPEEFIKIHEEEPTDNRISQMLNTPTSLNIENHKKNYVITATVGELWQRIIRFKLEESFVESGGITTVRKDDNKLIFSSVRPTKSFQRIYEFSDFGVVVNLIIDTGAQGKWTFKRI